MIRDEWNAFPRDAETELVRTIVTAYPAAYELAKAEYEEPEARYLRPHLRRVLIESELPTLQERFGDAISVGVRFNQSGDAYRVISCGRLVITQSHVAPDRLLPRHAESRSKIAESPDQFRLYPEDEAERINSIRIASQDSQYAILAHSEAIGTRDESGNKYRDAEKVGRIQAVFVDTKCNPIAKVDVLSRVGKREKAAVEVVPDNVDSMLRADAAKRLRMQAK